jgi:hypothetical protein
MEAAHLAATYRKGKARKSSAPAMITTENEQTARMAEYREKSIAIGLSTEPAVCGEAESGVALAYSAAGLLSAANPPSVVLR